MPTISMTISDAVPGEIAIHVMCDPVFPPAGRELSPAQKVALDLFGAHLKCLAAAPPYPKVRVTVNGHEPRSPQEVVP